MAKFIKFNCTSAANQATVLIPVDQITAVTTAGNGLTSTIQLNSSATSKWVITHPVALASIAQNSVVEAIYKAMVANPGGIVSTVGSPVLVAQAPVAQAGGNGRQPITTPQTYVTYTQNAWTA